MALVPVVVDTDILSAIMRRNPQALSQARVYLDMYGQFTLSIITRFEILRGLKAKGATSPTSGFCVYWRGSAGAVMSLFARK